MRFDQSDKLLFYAFQNLTKSNGYIRDFTECILIFCIGGQVYVNTNYKDQPKLEGKNWLKDALGVPSFQCTFVFQSV